MSWLKPNPKKGHNPHPPAIHNLAQSCNVGKDTSSIGAKIYDVGNLCKFKIMRIAVYNIKSFN